MKTTDAIKKGAGATMAGIIAAGGILGGAGTAFAAETLNVPDETNVPPGVENVVDGVQATQTPTTPDQAQKNLDDAKDNAKKVLETELGGGVGGSGETVGTGTGDGTTGGTDGTGTGNDNGTSTAETPTGTGNGIVSASQDGAIGNGGGNGTGTDAAGTKTVISDEAANAIAGAAKAQADADAVGDYTMHAVTTPLTVPNSNLSCIVFTDAKTARNFNVEFSNIALDETGVSTHNAPILTNELYNSLAHLNTTKKILTYTMTFVNYEGEPTMTFAMAGFSDFAGKSAWLFGSSANGTVFTSGPVKVSPQGIIDYGSVPVNDIGTYSIVIGEPPSQTTVPANPTPTDPTDPDPTPTTPTPPVTPTDPEPTNPPQEDVIIPDDNTGKDEPAQKPDTDVDQKDKTPVLDTGSDEKSDIGDKQVTKDDTQDADKKASITGTLPQTGDENGMLAAGLGLTAGANALIAAIGARRLRKERN